MIALDTLTKSAIMHTRHCLTGCGIGEILGMAIASAFLLGKPSRTALAVVLAFALGYGLTFRGARKGGLTAKDAIKIALAVDTISIISMEIIDNVIEYLVPGAMSARIYDAVFWWALALSLAIAFVLTVPVNRFMMQRSTNHDHH